MTETLTFEQAIQSWLRTRVKTFDRPKGIDAIDPRKYRMRALTKTDDLKITGIDGEEAGGYSTYTQWDFNTTISYELNGQRGAYEMNDTETVEFMKYVWEVSHGG